MAAWGESEEMPLFPDGTQAFAAFLEVQLHLLIAEVVSQTKLGL